MMRVLVAYGTKMGGTAGIAEMLGDALSTAGLQVDVRPASERADIGAYDAVIVGGALYNQRWHRHARRFVSRPLDDSATTGEIAPIAQVQDLLQRVGARGHATFGGRLAPDAKGLPASAMAKTRAGDWRDPTRIRSWAATVAQELTRPARDPELRAGGRRHAGDRRAPAARHPGRSAAGRRRPSGRGRRPGAAAADRRARRRGRVGHRRPHRRPGRPDPCQPWPAGRDRAAARLHRQGGLPARRARATGPPAATAGRLGAARRALPGDGRPRPHPAARPGAAGPGRPLPARPARRPDRAHAAGLGRSMPTDRLPILGRLPGLDGLYLAVTHSGVTLAPVLGPLVAEEIATGEQGRLLAPFRPGRFAERATRVAHDVDELFR